MAGCHAPTPAQFPNLPDQLDARRQQEPNSISKAKDRQGLHVSLKERPSQSSATQYISLRLAGHVFSKPCKQLIIHNVRLVTIILPAPISDAGMRASGAEASIAQSWLEQSAGNSGARISLRVSLGVNDAKTLTAARELAGTHATLTVTITGSEPDCTGTSAR